MKFNLNELIIEDLTIELDSKKVIVERQNIFDQLARFIYTYGVEELTNEVVFKMWKENSKGDVDIIDRIPISTFVKWNEKILEEGNEKYKEMGLLD